MSVKVRLSKIPDRLGSIEESGGRGFVQIPRWSTFNLLPFSLRHPPYRKVEVSNPLGSVQTTATWTHKGASWRRRQTAWALSVFYNEGREREKPTGRVGQLNVTVDVLLQGKMSWNRLDKERHLDCVIEK